MAFYVYLAALMHIFEIAWICKFGSFFATQIYAASVNIWLNMFCLICGCISGVVWWLEYAVIVIVGCSLYVIVLQMWICILGPLKSHPSVCGDEWLLGSVQVIFQSLVAAGFEPATMILVSCFAT